jgi:hypothetical protein
MVDYKYIDIIYSVDENMLRDNATAGHLLKDKLDSEITNVWWYSMSAILQTLILMSAQMPLYDY